MKFKKSQRHPEDLKSDKHLHMLVFGSLRMVVRNRRQSIWRSHNLRETQIQRLWLKVRDRLGLEVCASISCLGINLGRSRGHNLEASSVEGLSRCNCWLSMRVLHGYCPDGWCSRSVRHRTSALPRSVPHRSDSPINVSWFIGIRGR